MRIAGTSPSEVHPGQVSSPSQDHRQPRMLTHSRITTSPNVMLLEKTLEKNQRRPAQLRTYMVLKIKKKKKSTCVCEATVLTIKSPCSSKAKLIFDPNLAAILFGGVTLSNDSLSSAFLPRSDQSSQVMRVASPAMTWSLQWKSTKQHVFSCSLHK